MKDKRTSIEFAVSQVKDNSVVMVGGFGSAGTPFGFIDELLNQKPSSLTLIKNDANQDQIGVYKLVEAGLIKKLMVTHIGLNSLVMELVESGDLDVELVPQGILAERIRSAGVGLEGFVSRVGLGTEYENDKQCIELKGEKYIFEPAVRADFAFIHAHSVDTYGNVVFNTSGNNFSPMMAMAADVSFVESFDIRALGDILPETIHVSGAFIDGVCEINHRTGEYDAIRR